MTDQSPVLSELLSKHSTPAIHSPVYSLDRLSSFLQEAHKINSRLSELLAYLRSIRQPYLSNAPPPRRPRNATSATWPSKSQTEPIHLTDTDRDAVDAESKSILRDLNAAISSLSAAETTRQDAEAALSRKRNFLSGGGIVGRWAAGGGVMEKSDREVEEQEKRETVKIHRESILWFLRRRLEVCSGLQSEMMEVRVKREVEKSKSVLYKTRGVSSVDGFAALDDSVAVGGIGRSKENTNTMSMHELEEADASRQDDDIDEAQAQMFAKEGHDMLQHYENKLDQVRSVEQSLYEISSLQSTLASNLEIQSAQIDQLVSDSLSTTENVGAGNKQLKKASERKSTAKFVFWGTVGLCSVFVVWDLLI